MNRIHVYSGLRYVQAMLSVWYVWFGMYQPLTHISLKAKRIHVKRAPCLLIDEVLHVKVRYKVNKSKGYY